MNYEVLGELIGSAFIAGAIIYSITRILQEKSKLKKEIESAFQQNKISAAQRDNLLADLKSSYRVNLVRIRMLHFMDEHQKK